MKKSKPGKPLSVTSFRLPVDVREFLRQRARKEDRNMSYILVGVLRLWMNYLIEKEKQPKVAKK